MLRAFITQQGNVDVAAEHQQRTKQLESRRLATGGTSVRPESAPPCYCKLLLSLDLKLLLLPCHMLSIANRLPLCTTPT